MRQSGGDGVVLHPSVRGRYEVNASPFISSMQIIPFQISDLSGTHQGPVNPQHPQHQFPWLIPDFAFFSFS